MLYKEKCLQAEYSSKKGEHVWFGLLFNNPLLSTLYGLFNAKNWSICECNIDHNYLYLLHS